MRWLIKPSWPGRGRPKKGATMSNEFLSKETDIINALKTVYDPEIPVNIYDLGLIYEVDVQEDGKVRIVMTLTSPNCPVRSEERRVGKECRCRWSSEI